MRKDIKAFLEQNNFVFENRECVEYVSGYGIGLGSWAATYHKLLYKQYKYFQVMLFVGPNFDKRFPPHKKRGFIFSTCLTKQEQIDSYVYKDCVYFKMRNIELDYGKHANQTNDQSNSLRSLTDDMITYQGIRKLRELHKKICPTKFKGNWKSMNIQQLKKLLSEFDTYDMAIEKAIKEQKVVKKINKISEDF